MNYSNYESTA